VSLGQRAATYFICGGIPLYLRYFESERSVLQNIEHVILGEQAALYREPDFLLREELREAEKYYMILMVLAAGALPSRDIARQAGIGDRSLHYYLDQLASLGYFDKHFPLTSQVLTSEKHYFSAELNLAQAQLNERLALVPLYNALGGGWQ
jgi:uncharacterized protein